jgi:hypothetical protein
VKTLLLFFLLFFFSLWASELTPVPITPASISRDFMGITILDQQKMTRHYFEGHSFSELSDLAYDSLHHRLYMISDKGKLFLFHASFGEKIERLQIEKGVMLHNRKGKVLKHWQRDSEGMTFDKKGHLYLSFEGEAKVAEVGVREAYFGTLLRTLPLPSILRKTEAYRSPNKSLEALAWHPRYGLLTVAEWPLKRDHKKRQSIYALKGGRVWHFRAEPEARSAVVAMEVMDDGNLLIVERSYVSLLEPLVITLKKVFLWQQTRGYCRTKILAKMSTHKGWNIDNFEGLAKVGKHRYVMISDDNDYFFQSTLLLYFEVKE